MSGEVDCTTGRADWAMVAAMRSRAAGWSVAIIDYPTIRRHLCAAGLRSERMRRPRRGR